MILPHDLLTDPRVSHVFAGLARTERIVDVGCGIRPCPLPCDHHVCIEPHEEYVEVLRSWAPTDRTVTVIPGQADLLADQPRHGTTVLLLDVIEHMTKFRGQRIKRLAEEFEHAVVFTPLGWQEQSAANPDRWGYSGGCWQAHRSAWRLEDFEGWTLRFWRHYDTAGAILAIR